MTVDELFSQVEKLFNDMGLELEPGELSLKENSNDYSIKLLKNVIMKIKPGNRDHFFIKKVPNENLPDKYQADSLKSLPLYQRAWVIFDGDISDLKEYLLELYTRSLPDEDVFGCCNEFNVCSDNMSCVKSIKFAARCMYKQNLDAGRIFYGKNRSI